MSSITSVSDNYNALYPKTEQTTVTATTEDETTETAPVSIWDMSANLSDEDRKELFSNLQSDAGSSLSDYEDAQKKGLDAIGSSLAGNE